MAESDGQSVPAIGAGDLDYLAPVVFGYAIPWESYIEELQNRCRGMLERGEAPVIVLIEAPRFLAWCAANQVEPRSSGSLADFARQTSADGLPISQYSDLRMIIRTHEVQRALGRMVDGWTLAPGTDFIFQALREADRLMDVLATELPGAGQVRITQAQSEMGPRRVCDISSSPETEDEAFPGDLGPLVRWELALGIATTGTLVAECEWEEDWGYMMWLLERNGSVPLSADDAKFNALQSPDLLPPHVDPSTTAVDAYELLDDEAQDPSDSDPYDDS